MAPLVDTTNHYHCDQFSQIEDVSKVSSVNSNLTKCSPKKFCMNIFRSFRIKKKRHRKSDPQDSTRKEILKKKEHCELPALKTINTVNNISQEENSEIPEVKKDEQVLLVAQSTEPPIFNSENNSEVLHKCIACGAETQTAKLLEKHLMCHVLEGMRAAMWLSNAMTQLLPSSPCATFLSQLGNNSHEANISTDL